MPPRSWRCLFAMAWTSRDRLRFKLGRDKGAVLGHERHILKPEYEPTNQAFIQTCHIPAKLVENGPSAIECPSALSGRLFRRRGRAGEFLLMEIRRPAGVAVSTASVSEWKMAPAAAIDSSANKRSRVAPKLHERGWHYRYSNFALHKIHLKPFQRE